MTIQIVAPHFCAGVELGKYNTVVSTAPILSYMLTWGRHDVEKYCKRKGWGYHIIGEIPKCPISTNEIIGR